MAGQPGLSFSFVEKTNPVRLLIIFRTHFLAESRGAVYATAPSFQVRTRTMSYMETYEHIFDIEPSYDVCDLVSLESLANLVPHPEQQYLPGWLTVSFSLFFIGMTGMVYNYKNFLITMMCVEIMYLGAVTGFIMYGLAFHDVLAAIYALLILIFAACESAIGLGLLVAVYRYGRSIGFNSFVDLGG